MDTKDLPIDYLRETCEIRIDTMDKSSPEYRTFHCIIENAIKLEEIAKGMYGGVLLMIDLCSSRRAEE